MGEGKKQSDSNRSRVQNPDPLANIIIPVPN